ncbi:helix-turn-helix transcriptional regulator [Bacillus shivajii]|uniref:helix-turn-helix domain-containing protein n=1 Tax=Bacillus shivajii TaxID=1983719 RepID=UPI001CFB7EDB|nr:helix-turn-helix domain-containing protein [Bacillus shivajii]UCZ54171.1 helix-turn-helix transcriptional regulator [Bacillus shivajii]
MSENWQVGNVIRMLRTANNFSQSDIADGICTLSEISQIEDNIKSPDSNTLHLLANRLGVDMNFFFEELESPKIHYAEDTIYLIRKFVEEKKYEEVGQVIENERHNPIFHKPRFKQVILWHEALVVNYVKGDFKTALKLLYQALNMYQPSIHYTETQIQILVSLGNLYGENDHHAKAQSYYEKAILNYEKLTKLECPKIFLRILYNLTLTFIREHKYEDALSRCEQGLQLCKETKSLYLLGEFHYQMANIHWFTGRLEEANKEMTIAATIFDYTDNIQYKKFVSSKINEINR